ncbi:SDR family oxidoreductase [Niveispirillum sp. SYP-B3756]|uniref:SDR family NAD(P)-dependent oxidoreductase n=1 Tax=Niveispirillum sp. SYP-B3756 TaxID=2662178 RepID=UPI0012910C5B|nr:SDR family oxidoreductase [Niveispirillum sp. SYP-B3756]MQP68316.1 SDR family oxidoreductase [Niveispirillum sp. SYP-B3756]
MGDVAIVFGGTGGLGAGCVRALGRDWQTVAIGYRRARDKAADLARDLLPGSTGFPVECDVSDPASVQAAVALVSQQCGQIGTAIFASGCDIEQPYISEITSDEWRRVIETEVLGFTHVLAALIPVFRQQKKGNFVAVTSMANTRYIVGDALSAVPKAAIETLSRGVAKEEGRHGIRCNTVAPGAMASGLGERYMVEKFTPEFWAGFRKSIPLRDFGTADDIGEAVAFFASERARYLTGQTLIVDGGYTL